jgi:dienelactone hydrolase
VFASSLLIPALALAALADGPADNIATTVRPVPPPGVSVPPADRALLEQGLADLGRQIAALRGKTAAAPYLADVQIYHNAVRYALQYGEFFNVKEIDTAKALLATGQERAGQLAAGQTPWLTKAGPTALGYVSEIDGSVQPYGLYIPEGYDPNGSKKWRLDTWFHGRGETLSEVNFISGAQRSGGPFARPDLFVVQLYGRYCNANKLAGETDTFEALKDIKKRFKIDDDRIVVRGFSMGGAAAWQFAAHFASDWAAAAPGAGFSETPDFLKVFQKETLEPTPWEVKLWQMYDCPVYSPNLANVPIVAYSGEIDSQKQAADVMEKAMAAEGIKLPHIIGPKTGHSYHKDSIPEINAFVDKAAAKGRNRMPRKVRLATPTLKYNRQAWVTVDALGHHWERATVDAEVTDDHTVSVKTANVEALTLAMPAGLAPLSTETTPSVSIDGQTVSGPRVASDHSWTVHLQKSGGKWKTAKSNDGGGVRKRHDLQGPIDDAFMGSFMIVRPTGTPANPGVSRWVDAELQHAITEWRRQFRGEARIKNDVDVTAADIAAHNLVLWGDPGSNKILGKVAGKLPIRWTKDAVVVGKQQFPAGTHAPVLVYPNPLNSKRYLVVNSGVTFREYDYLNNARQVPKLPDWAIVDTTTPPNSRYTGKIVTADFFGERWELTPSRAR